MFCVSISYDELLEAIYADDKVTIREYLLLRDVADACSEIVIEKLGANNNYTAFQKTCDVAVQLMQNIAFELVENESLECHEVQAVLDSMEAQVNYITAFKDLMVRMIGKN